PMAPLAKNVVVFRNGDPFFLGRKFVVSHRRFLTFDAFLNEVTSTVQAPVAIRSIYTPRGGHRIMELSELQNGCQYVAAGFERFKRLEPSQGPEFQGKPSQAKCQSGTGRGTKAPSYVFRNGDLLSPPFRMVLARSALQEWGIVLSRLSEKANLHTGVVKKLCKLNGDLVSRGEELVNGEYYVAVGLEKYKDLPYFELLVPPKIPHRPFRRKEEEEESSIVQPHSPNTSVLPIFLVREKPNETLGKRGRAHTLCSFRGKLVKECLGLRIEPWGPGCSLTLVVFLADASLLN
uniref:Doublecortin domain containing 2B n=1 Tax=Pseudonaja textilis TaxID=8673 RepID=A0A670YAY5_PSETE